MSAAVMQAYAGALLSAALAWIVARKERRSVAHWSFVAGMLVLAAEGLLTGLTGEAQQLGPGYVARMDWWQTLELATMAFLPGIWLVFSLTYARGNDREFLAKWRWVVTGAFALPVALVALFGRHLVSAVPPAGDGERWGLAWGASGLVLQVIFLTTAVLVLINLERTYRAAVGTMRWRIKFTVVGLGVLFAVRGYTSSQVVFSSSKAVDLALQHL